jgi:hypothetical protein
VPHEVAPSDLDFVSDEVNTGRLSAYRRWGFAIEVDHGPLGRGEARRRLADPRGKVIIVVLGNVARPGQGRPLGASQARSEARRCCWTIETDYGLNWHPNVVRQPSAGDSAAEAELSALLQRLHDARG